jgi:membrane protein required for colicin V production
MPIFDIVLLVLFFGFVFVGFWLGLIHTLGAIIGMVVGLVVASNFYGQISPFLQFLFVKPSIANFVSFVVVFLVVSRLIGFVFYRIEKAFKIITFLPLVGAANRLGGALLGFVEGAFVLGIVLMIATSFALPDSFLNMIDNSAFAQLLIKIAKILTPLVAESLRTVQARI